MCNIAHPFFATLHDVNDEPTAERMVDQHEAQNYTVKAWKCK